MAVASDEEEEEQAEMSEDPLLLHLVGVVVL